LQTNLSHPLHTQVALDFVSYSAYDAQPYISRSKQIANTDLILQALNYLQRRKVPKTLTNALQPGEQ
jgi:hypothetical protein